jgi:hypothetical protein
MLMLALITVLVIVMVCCGVLYCRVVGMETVSSVTFAERPAFYREKQSEMYSPLLHVATNTLVEIPYILVSSLLFTLPFFFIVGMDQVGDVLEKFVWYWVFMALLLCSLIFAGQFFAVLLPDAASAGGGLDWMGWVMLCQC